jgi:acyl dehydratase
MAADYYLEDFEPGHTYTSPTHTISDEEALDFARRYDPQYFHLDPVAARDSVFGGVVLGGFQTAALAWTLVLKTGMFDKSAMAGIGLDEVRWHKPVRPNLRPTLRHWRCRQKHWRGRRQRAWAATVARLAPS